MFLLNWAIVHVVQPGGKSDDSFSDLFTDQSGDDDDDIFTYKPQDGM